MNHNHALSDNELQQLAPSIFATQPDVDRSSRYTFVSTIDVVNGLRQAGFFPVMASQVHTKWTKDNSPDFAKHLLRFRQNPESLTKVDESLIEVVLINSHDGTSRYVLMGGVFRLVCSNGMVVADSLIGAVRVKHIGDIIGEVVTGSNLILEQAPKVMDVINDWKTITLTGGEQKLLAETAHEIRYPRDEETGVSKTHILPEHLLVPRRNEDNKPDLWNTFNRIQENATKGFRTHVHRHNVTARPITGIDGDIKLNRALWTMAEKFAELKTGIPAIQQIS